MHKLCRIKDKLWVQYQCRRYQLNNIFTEHSYDKVSRV